MNSWEYVLLSPQMSSENVIPDSVGSIVVFSKSVVWRNVLRLIFFIDCPCEGLMLGKILKGNGKIGR